MTIPTFRSAFASAVIAGAFFLLAKPALATQSQSKVQPPAQATEVQQLVQELNFYYPELNVQPADGATPKGALHDLQVLESVLIDQAQLPKGSLQELACNKPVCNGGNVHSSDAQPW